MMADQMAPNLEMGSSSMSTSSIISGNFNNNYKIITSMDDNYSYSASSSFEEDLKGYTSLHDIFQALSEVPLHATPTSPPQILNEVNNQGYQISDEVPRLKDVDLSKVIPKGKQLLEPVVENEPPCDDEHHDQHESSKRLSQRRTNEHRRRERINTKMRAIRALLPDCDKGDHASILDQAIKHIKSLKLQIEMMARTAGQSQAQNLYGPQMVMRPTMLPRIGYGPWASQMSTSAYPYMATQPMTHIQVQAQAPFTQIFCPIQYIPTTMATPSTPTVLSFIPPVPQFNQPNSSNERPRI